VQSNDFPPRAFKSQANRSRKRWLRIGLGPVRSNFAAREMTKWRAKMTSVAPKVLIALSAVLLLASCANTIRGAGHDVKNTANATEHAVKDVAN
jgi:predicted small secreted protein